MWRHCGLPLQYDQSSSSLTRQARGYQHWGSRQTLLSRCQARFCLWYCRRECARSMSFGSVLNQQHLLSWTKKIPSTSFPSGKRFGPCLAHSVEASKLQPWLHREPLCLLRQRSPRWTRTPPEQFLYVLFTSDNPGLIAHLTAYYIWSLPRQIVAHFR